MNEKIIQVYVCMVDVSRYVWYGMVVIKVFIFRYSFPRCNTCGRNWYLFTDPIFTHLGYFTHFGNLTTLYIWPPWIFYPPWIFHTFWIFYPPWIFDHLAPRLPLCLAITNILQEIDFLKQFNNAILKGIYIYKVGNNSLKSPHHFDNDGYTRIHDDDMGLKTSLLCLW